MTTFMVPVGSSRDYVLKLLPTLKNEIEAKITAATNFFINKILRGSKIKME